MSPSNPHFWRDKKVVVTGHTGFKGTWLSLWLWQLGARVLGLSLAPTTDPSLFEACQLSRLVDSRIQDIRDAPSLAEHLSEFDPEIIFHLAAQPLVLRSYERPAETFTTNTVGTLNVLESARFLSSLRVLALITTDKVYENTGSLRPYKESDTIGGIDPYSASKSAAELIISSYSRSYLHEKDIAVAALRAGNVIGGGDWEPSRLLPGAILSWQQGQPLVLRRPTAIRPWQHVLEPCSAYLTIAATLWGDSSLSGAYNLGPSQGEVLDVLTTANLAKSAYGAGASVVCDRSAGNDPEQEYLLLDSAKARTNFGIKPKWNTQIAIEKTIEWYKRFNLGADAADLCFGDIGGFGAS